MTNHISCISQRHRRFLFAGTSILLWLSLSTQFVTAQTNTFPASGKVGIGVLYPDSKLDIRDVQPQLQLFETASGGRRRLRLEVGVNNEIRLLSTYGVGGNYPFTFRFGGSVGEVMRIATNGNVGIGTASPRAKLAVEGNILAKEVKVKTDISVPDYVFKPDYELPALSEIEAYVREHRHLPEIPPAADIERDGLDLAEINLLLLLKKVEEMTLHIIKQEKQLDRQASLMERRQKEFDAFRKEIESRIGSITNQ